jgi:Dehydrogenase E1 component
MTYRYRGHSVADAGLSYRTRDETGAWIDKDPIALLRQRLLGEGMSEEELVVLERYVDERVSVGPTSRPRSRSSAGIYAPVSAERGWADGSTAHEHHGGPGDHHGFRNSSGPEDSSPRRMIRITTTTFRQARPWTTARSSRPARRTGSWGSRCSAADRARGGRGLGLSDARPVLGHGRHRPLAQFLPSRPALRRSASDTRYRTPSTARTRRLSATLRARWAPAGVATETVAMSMGSSTAKATSEAASWLARITPFAARA